MSCNYLAANWKMNLDASAAAELAGVIAEGCSELSRTVVWIAPTFTSIHTVAGSLAETSLRVGAQNVHWEESGAFTGEVSVSMLKEAGCSFVIVGHSERRHIFGESSEMVAKRFKAAAVADLTPILCVGETLEERERGETEAVLDAQLAPCLNGLNSNLLFLIAYEPVWAIGTGRVASLEQISEAHGFIKHCLREHGVTSVVPVLYGGSVKPDNFSGIIRLEDVSGALVGGASLKTESFRALIDISETA